jgi:uncharacterized protein YacL
MILVELVRLVIVLALTAAGYQAGQHYPSIFAAISKTPETALLLSTIVGAGLGYVLGGAVGRFAFSAVGAVERQVDRISGAELVSGALGLLGGALAALLVSWPVLIFVPFRIVSYAAVALIFLLFSYAGYRVSARKRVDVLAMMGLSQSRNFSTQLRQTAAGPRVLDTSAIIDGRVVDVARAGFLSGRVICPKFVLEEIQSIADSPDPTRRARGRRALEVLDSLQGDPRLQLEVPDEVIPDVHDVDAKLVALAKRLSGVLVTTDYNLHKVAELQGVPVLNLNNLADALKPAVIAGEEVQLQILKEGTQNGQGVGYLDDGTMVVVEGAAAMVGREISAVVTSVLQTPSGRMIFSNVSGR